MELLNLDYVPGDPAEPAKITLRRGDQIVELSYRPAGPKVRATQWERDPKVPPEECVTF